MLMDAAFSDFVERDGCTCLVGEWSDRRGLFGAAVDQ